MGAGKSTPFRVGMKANTPQKAKHNPVFNYNLRVRKSTTYGTAGTVGTIKNKHLNLKR